MAQRPQAPLPLAPRIAHRPSSSSSNPTQSSSIRPIHALSHSLSLHHHLLLNHTLKTSATVASTRDPSRTSGHRRSCLLFPEHSPLDVVQQFHRSSIHSQRCTRRRPSRRISCPTFPACRRKLRQYRRRGQGSPRPRTLPNPPQQRTAASPATLLAVGIPQSPDCAAAENDPVLEPFLRRGSPPTHPRASRAAPDSTTHAARIVAFPVGACGPQVRSPLYSVAFCFTTLRPAARGGGHLQYLEWYVRDFGASFSSTPVPEGLGRPWPHVHLTSVHSHRIPPLPFLFPNNVLTPPTVVSRAADVVKDGERLENLAWR